MDYYVDVLKVASKILFVNTDGYDSIYWVSPIDIADELSISVSNVHEALDFLESRNLVRLDRGRTDGSLFFEEDDVDNIDWENTIIKFISYDEIPDDKKKYNFCRPHPHQVEDIVKTHYPELLYSHNGFLPKYLLRLKYGYPSVEWRYFHESVIKKYLDNPNYDVSTHIGCCKIMGEYIIPFSKHDHTNGDKLVSVILVDLARLPKKEQLMWGSYEVDNVNVENLDDQSVENAWGRRFHGAWTFKDDPLDMLKKQVNRSNCLLSGDLFPRHKELDQVRYPQNDNSNDYYRCCKDLNVVVVENLDRIILKDLLISKFGIEKSHFDPLSKWKKNNGFFWNKFYLLQPRSDKIDKLCNSIKVIKKPRNENSHTIIDKNQVDNYTDKFYMAVNSFTDSLKDFNDVCEGIITP